MKMVKCILTAKDWDQLHRWISYVKISFKLLCSAFQKLSSSSSLYVPCSPTSEFCTRYFLFVECPSLPVCLMGCFLYFQSQLSQHFLWDPLPEFPRDTEASSARLPQCSLRTTDCSAHQVLLELSTSWIFQTGIWAPQGLCSVLNIPGDR